MKKTLTILAVICCFIAVFFAVLPISNLAIFPGTLALIFGGIAYYLSKKNGGIKKIIPFTLLLTICALSMATYKAVFIKTVVADTTILNEKEIQLEEQALEELEDLDIEVIDKKDTQDIKIDNSEAENMKLNKDNIQLEDSELETIEFEDLN